MTNDLAKQYVHFQQQVGVGVNDIWAQTIPLLFCDSFQKTANGISIVSQRHQLKDQLLHTRQVSGSWEIQLHEIILFQDPYRCLIRYQLMAEKLGRYEVMAILTHNGQQQIQRIEEMYYQVIV